MIQSGLRFLLWILDTIIIIIKLFKHVNIIKLCKSCMRNVIHWRCNNHVILWMLQQGNCMFVEHILQASILSASEVIESKSHSNNVLDDLYLQWAGSIGVAIYSGQTKTCHLWRLWAIVGILKPIFHQFNWFVVFISHSSRMPVTTQSQLLIPCTWAWDWLIKI